ncbi:SLEI domain protein, PF07620 family, partial [Leptospira interrogans serovar Djasiman str. LT1649]
RKFLKNQLSFFIKEFVSKPQRILSDNSLEISNQMQ